MVDITSLGRVLLAVAVLGGAVAASAWLLGEYPHWSAGEACYEAGGGCGVVPPQIHVFTVAAFVIAWLLHPLRHSDARFM